MTQPFFAFIVRPRPTVALMPLLWDRWRETPQQPQPGVVGEGGVVVAGGMGEGGADAPAGPDGLAARVTGYGVR